MSPLTVFYDGACRLCYREIRHYKNKDSKNLLELVDISHENFNAEEYGLDQDEVNLHMHTKSNDGQVFKGVDSFIEIWKRIPPYDYLIPLFENQKLRPFINNGYDFFAREIRPKLPKRNCEEGNCSLAS